MATDLHDATTLISELTSKLDELDTKVAAYRLDMAADFTRHSEELLRTVPEDVAYRVSRAIADQLSNYPSLYPPGTLSSSRSATPTTFDDLPWREKTPPAPVTPQPSANSTDSAPEPPRQRDPHERELEFQGLFTPTYLPLLESVDRPLHSPPTSPGAADPAIAARRLSAGSAPVTDTSHRRRRPSPLRRATDTSIDSFVSDSSSAKVRKSALRRSSNSSKADSPRDPRRVRFDFQGQEVLPSSSPQTSAVSPPAKTDGSEESAARAVESYSSSLGDIEGDEDLQGEKPKKVSSTQALRALSKAPLDKETVWTVVNPGAQPEDQSDADKNHKPATGAPTPQPGTEKNDMTVKQFTPHDEEEARGHTPAQAEGAAKNDVRGGQSRLVSQDSEADADEEDSEEEMTLFMTSKRGQHKSKVASSQAEAPPAPASPKPSSPMAIDPPSLYNSRPVESPAPAMPQTAGGLAQSVATGNASFQKRGLDLIAEDGSDEEAHQSTGVEHDEEDFFGFDDDKNTTQSPPPKYLPELHEEEEEQELDEKLDRAADTTESSIDLPSSPPINAPDQPRPEEQPVPAKVRPKPESARVLGTSIGSFVDREGRKHSLTPGPVKDPELLKKLENLDIERPFFVGSVNGNSGVDASNVKSYQASLMSPTQTSGSFAERLIWEKSQSILYDSDQDDINGVKKGRR